MKKLLLYIFIFTNCLPCHSQKKDKNVPLIITCPIPTNNAVTPRVIDANTIFTYSEVDTKPKYPDGMERFSNYLINKYKTPDDFLDNETSRRIFVGFTIEKDGSLSDFKIYREPKPGIGNELIKILKSSPNWNPGLINNKAVRVAYILPFKIPYRDENKK